MPELIRTVPPRSLKNRDDVVALELDQASVARHAGGDRVIGQFPRQRVSIRLSDTNPHPLPSNTLDFKNQFYERSGSYSAALSVRWDLEGGGDGHTELDTFR